MVDCEIAPEVISLKGGMAVPARVVAVVVATVETEPDVVTPGVADEDDEVALDVGVVAEGTGDSEPEEDVVAWRFAAKRA